MIDGVLLQEIVPTDYYRRFIVLKMLLERGREGSQLEQAEDSGRYVQIEQELQGLEVLITAKDSKVQSNTDDIILRIDDLHSQLSHIIPRVRERKDTYEADLLKRWRNALTIKKKKEEENKKQKDAKSTSNKNLMYLTSQLLKKQRISRQNLNLHKEKIERIHERMECVLTETDLQFKNKLNNLRQMMNNEKNRVNGMIEQYKESLQAQKTQFLSQSKQVLDQIQQQLKKQHESFIFNSKGIKEILVSIGYRK